MSDKPCKVIVGCSGSVDFAKRIAAQTKCRFIPLDTKKFPDGELNLRFTSDIKGKKVYLVQSFYDPNDKLIEVFFAAKTAKELGARGVFIIAPYLCYMRQDKRFRPYEAISSRVMAAIMNRLADGIITVDPHLHRYKSLDEIFTIRTKTLTADDLIADYIKDNIKSPIIIGPDMESYQWARTVAEKIGCEVDVLKKKRYTSEHVAIKIKKRLDLGGKSVVLIDDIISTGHTMMEVVKDVKRLGAKRIYCICVHALFVENSYEKLRKMGAEVVSCNTIPHKSNGIDVSGLISREI
ncbi:phosphoribosylpyrophosphate synthetase [Candidatus Woesearchaeota archaeon CG10_big_fil_rev_8_21_14_0_10_44_13]|nr:MAG: phosphoribosylpyrophosphate synthetase [Candidatus Woesearchaeota archaeon CG10_big_fil_rev_8_21_14_0_10_44_13]